MMRTFDQNGVSLEDLELVHLGLGHLDDRVVVVLGVLNSQFVRGLLSLQDCLGNVLLFAIGELVKRRDAYSIWGLRLK